MSDPIDSTRGSIPDVIFTPRVSVRRMCTPSRILFAASVRLISSMIFSLGGISANERAMRGATQPLEVFSQFENAAIVKSQPFPNRIATLHRRIEWTDSGFVTMHEATVDVDDQVAVLLVKLLQHFLRL